MSRLFIDGASSLQYNTGSWRKQQPLFHKKWPPCGQICPASEDIQAYLSLVANEQWQEAWKILTDFNPFPAVMGRVCYHPCELGCNRHHFDETLNIHSIERFLGDMALQNAWSHEVKVHEPQNKKVAIVGAGPAGLSCAFHLRRHGYPVSLFEAEAHAGGALRWGIPDYRLPKSVLQAEIDNILAMGIEVHFNARVGKQISAAEILQEFDASFLAPGSSLARNIEGYEDCADIMTGIEFLSRVNNKQQSAITGRVLVLGGGNTAMDAARSALRLGAKVTVVCPQQRPGKIPGHNNGEHMPAIPEEITAAEEEGIELLTRTGMLRIIRNGSHVAGMEVAKVGHVHDGQGNFNPLFYEGTESFIPANLIVLAMGQGVDWSGMDLLLKHKEDHFNVVIGGDAAGRPRMAANAVGSGHKAAHLLMAYLTGIPEKPYTHQFAEIPFKKLNTHYYRHEARQDAGGRPVQKRVHGFGEIMLGLDQQAVQQEASRCFSCGVCFECDNCWHFCPDAAVLKIGPGKAYKFDYDYCKGCGICAKECPCGHIEMEELEDISLV